jgi:hypothetical protein
MTDVKEMFEPGKPLTPYEIFLAKHVTRVKQWIDDHPSKPGHPTKPFPIIADPNEPLGFRWLKRAERRR